MEGHSKRKADDRVLEWELGLPSPSDLTPLSQSLITPVLASSFGLVPDPSLNLLDFNQSLNSTSSTICSKEESFEPLQLFPSKYDDSDNSKIKRVENWVGDYANSGHKVETRVVETGLNRAVKRPRLVWTPQLHKRFVDVLEHLGIEKAVPKAIMEMMNVEGLTRENVASHLQKYRLYLKRKEETLSSEGHPTPAQGHCNSVPLMPLVVVGHPAGVHRFGHLGMAVGNSGAPGYCGFESGTYSTFWNRQRG